MASLRRVVPVFVVCVCLVVTVTGPVTAVVHSDTAGPVGQATDAGKAGGVSIQDNDQPDNESNETDPLRHENPGNVSVDGDLDQIKGWLAGRMSGTLVDCTQGIEIGDYDLCQELQENGDYPEFLGKYVDVAGETDTDEDDAIAAELNETGDRQVAFGESTRDFRSTYAEYQTARREGDTERSRRLARELLSDGERVLTLGRELNESYAKLSAAGFDVGPAQKSVTNVTTNVSQTLEEVQTETFEPTILTARTPDDAVSFVDPLVVNGRLTTANGTGLANRTIRLPVEGQLVTATTNDTGWYTLTYRPTNVSTGPTEFQVAYVPAPTAPYQRATSTVSVTVEATDPTVTLSSVTDAAGYGDTVAITGTVQAGGIGAANVPVVVTIAGQRVATGTTDEDGDFSIEASLPASIPIGDQPITVRAGQPGLAIAPGNVTASFAVEPEPTSVSITATQSATDSRAITVSGQVTTVDGEVVRNGEVVMTVAGTQVATVLTRADGTFETTVSVPGSLELAEPTTVGVEATFDATGTNLESASARTDVRLDPPAGSTSTDQDGSLVDGTDPGSTTTDEGGSLTDGTDPESIITQYRQTAESILAQYPIAVPVGIALVVVVALALLIRTIRRRRWVWGRDADAGGRPDPTNSLASSASGESGDSDDESTRLEVARDRLEGGDPNGAIQLAYAAVRDAVADGSTDGRPTTQTHWEFYESRLEGIGDEDREALERITEAYERAAFAPEGLDDDGARNALQAATSLAPK